MLNEIRAKISNDKKEAIQELIKNTDLNFREKMFNIDDKETGKVIDTGSEVKRGKGEKKVKPPVGRRGQKRI